MRIGRGYDVCRFGGDSFITLGDVRIPRKHGPVAYSDDDVLLHALSNTLLGAVALGDIDKHFPDTDLRFKGVDSCALLRHVVTIVAERGWKVGSVNTTIIAQALKVAPHAGTIRGSIAEDLDVAVGQVNVKATTAERLGFTGREEDITVHTVALLMAR